MLNVGHVLSFRQLKISVFGTKANLSQYFSGCFSTYFVCSCCFGNGVMDNSER